MNHQRTLLRFGVGVFLYIVVLAGLIQLVLLPHVFRGWHAGHGLLVMGDWIDFHEVAVEMASRIRNLGWSEFHLRPPPRAAIESGLLGYLYVFLPNEPWIIIPANALFHALAAVLLVQMVVALTGNLSTALLGSLPFIFFPSSLIWTAQIHKDGICILSVFLFIRGWQLLVTSARTRGVRDLPPLLGLVFIFTGCLVTWVVRPYLLVIYVSFGWVILLLAFLHFAINRINLFRTIPLIVIQAFFFVAAVMVPTIDRLYPQADITAYKIASKRVFEGLGEGGLGAKPTLPSNLRWYETPYLPKFIEVKLHGLSDVRNGFANDGHAGTNFDNEYRFARASDIVKYLPRAFVAAVAAPFPRMWFANSKFAASNTVFRRLVGFEMLFVYLCLPFLLGSFIIYRKQLEYQCVVGFSLFTTLIYTLAVPNAAALHRFRYGFLMILLAIAISSAPEVIVQLGNALKRFRGSEYSNA